MDLAIVIFLSVALRKIPNLARFKINSKQLGKHYWLLWVQKVILMIKSVGVRTYVIPSRGVSDLTVWMNCSACQSDVWFKNL